MKRKVKGEGVGGRKEEVRRERKEKEGEKGKKGK